MKKNKYEDIEMLELEDKIYITDFFINRLYDTDKIVGVIVNKELVEYILDEIIKLDETSVKEIDLVDYININEYLLSVDDDGYITCVPIEDLCVLDNTDIFYIDMDGDIKQDIIDYCVNEDKEVILFGQEGDNCDGDCEHCKDAIYKVNGKEVSENEYYDELAKYDELDSLIDEYNERIELLENLYRLFGV